VGRSCHEKPKIGINEGRGWDVASYRELLEIGRNGGRGGAAASYRQLKKIGRNREKGREMLQAAVRCP
jgi:hypothetical protein